MTSASRIGRIGDDVLAQCTAANLFTAAALGLPNDATATFSYAYNLDVQTADKKCYVTMIGDTIEPTRTGTAAVGSGGGSQQCHYGAAIAVYMRYTLSGDTATDRAALDPLVACAENITRLLLGSTAFDTTASCVDATLELGDALNDDLAQRNLFMVVVNCVFQDNLSGF